MLEKFRYRPEIDGLRAIAVSAVVLFHAGLGCPGGYVGVDVFFVISGFLITSLIWKDLQHGCFTLAMFWERRARRIVPALVVLTLATWLAGWCLLLPEDFKSLGHAVVSQVAFAANFNYWLESGYFDGAAEEKPLLHTWSLAVEEQFYLIVPWLLAGLHYLTQPKPDPSPRQHGNQRRQRAVVATCIGLAIVASLTASLLSLDRYRSATFYLLPQRAWELLCGSLVAFLPLPGGTVRQTWREALSATGLLLIGVPIFYYDSTTPFPGLAALPPCLGAALVIWVDGGANAHGLTQVSRLLSRPPLVFIGLISYSLYLWHWPFFAFAKYRLLAEPSLHLRLSLLAAGVLSAVLSWRFVETPFRQKRLGATRNSVFAWSASGLAGVLAVGLFCIFSEGLPQRFPPSTLALAEAKNDMAFFNQLSVEDIRSGRLVSIGSQTSQRPPDVLVWGDSHAMAAMPALDELLKEKGLSGKAATHSSTLPVCGWYVPTKYGLQEQSLEFSAEVFDYVKKSGIRHVLLVAYWRGYGLSDAGRRAEFETALLGTIRDLAKEGAQAWVLLDVPVHGFDIPKALSRSQLSVADLAELCSRPESLSQDGPNSLELTQKVIAAGGRILDPKPMFMSPTGDSYLIQSDDVALYRDGHHLTTRGAKLLLLPYLRNALAELGNE